MAERAWRIDEADIDGSYRDFNLRVSRGLTELQRRCVAATAGYLTAYLASETGERSPTILIDSSEWSGRSRDGRLLDLALDSFRIGIKVKLAAGVEVGSAIEDGRQRAFRSIALDTDQAARLPLLKAIDEDERFSGWVRSPKGTCAACLAVTSGQEERGTRFEIHPNCNCIAAPVVVGVAATIPFLTGDQILQQKTPEERRAELGVQTAEALDENRVQLDELGGKTPMENEPDYLSQAALPESAK
jgi:hypothetical protein